MIRMTYSIMTECSETDCPLFPTMKEDRLGYASGSIIKTTPQESWILSAAHVCNNIALADPDTQKMFSDGKLFLNFYVIDRLGKEYQVKSTSFSPIFDICVLKTAKPIDGYKPIKIAVKEPMYGTRVWSFGANAGEYGKDILPMLDGYLAGHDLESKSYLVSDMAVYPGQSGSMLINESGELIGLVVGYKMKISGATLIHINELAYAVDLGVVRWFVMTLKL